MNTFKKKSLHAAVLAGLGALGAAGTANAVHINPDGLGQVVIYPYFTVRNGNATLMSIINTTSLTKAVKVRFLEGKNSREVLDFNLFLSPQDIWTGVILATADGAKLETGDNSCVTPSDLFGNSTGVLRTDSLGLPLNSFKNYQYTGANVDNTLFGTLDRTREGYIEVIEMGVVVDATLTGFIKHNSAGVPANCAALDAYDGLSTSPTPVVKFPGTAAAPTLYLTSPAGGLTGRASLINSAAGTNYTYDVTVLDGWWAPAVPAGGNVPYSASGVTTPSISLQTGIDTVSNVFVTGNPAVPNSAGVVRAVWPTSREAVSSVFMRDTVINEFVTDAGTVSKTDWVVTMPTKRDNIGVGSGTPNRPFSNNFNNTAAGSGACDAYAIGMYNREEQTITAAPGTLLPSPRPPAASAAGQNLCWEANVIEFASTGLLGSSNNTRLLNGYDTFAASGAVSTGAAFATLSRRVLQGPNGWAFLSFGTVASASQAQQSMTPTSTTLNGGAVVAGVFTPGASEVPPRTFYGLPMIGAMFHNYTNSGVASSYGGVIPHKYTRLIQ